MSTLRLVSPRRLRVDSVAGLLALGMLAAPSFAATTATITVEGGTLQISAPTGSVDLGSLANTVGGGTISGSLGEVQVSDARSAAAGSGWVASVISSAFTPKAGPAIVASAVGYAAGTITKVAPPPTPLTIRATSQA